MTVMRDKHPPWCKRRALKYIDAGDLSNAVASMAFDLKSIQALTTRHSKDRLGSR